MTAKDKKTAQILGVLVMIAGLTWFFVYRTDTATSSANTGKKQKGKPTATQEFKETQIRLGEISGNGQEPVGTKNIFQYRQKPIPESQRPKAIVAAPPPPYVPPPAPPPVGPPPPPPMKNFKYDGFSGPKAGKMVASLTDGTTTFQVTLGECLMGQYCVRQLSENTIEIEDLQLKQRKTFTRTPAP